MDAKKRLTESKRSLLALFKTRRTNIILCLGIGGIILIMLSVLLPSGFATTKKNPDVGVSVTSEEYASQMEDKLTGIIGKIEGVGKCEVMVTLESGVEYIYAVEETMNINETNNFEGEEVKKQSQQNNIQQKYIVVDAGSGKKEALLKTGKPPAIQGVVVVCEGAGSAVVQERVTQAITTALGISYGKVCVTKIS